MKAVILNNDYKDLYFGYVNRYCANTLTTITLREINYMKLNGYFPTLFECVEKVTIQKSYLNERFLYADKIFPKLRELVLSDVDVYEVCSHIHFTHLEKLTMKFECTPLPWMLKDPLNLVRANPQIERIGA